MFNYSIEKDQNNGSLCKKQTCSSYKGKSQLPHKAGHNSVFASRHIEKDTTVLGANFPGTIKVVSTFINQSQFVDDEVNEDQYTRMVEPGIAVVASPTLKTYQLGHFIHRPGPDSTPNVRPHWEGKICSHVAIRDIERDEELLVELTPAQSDDDKSDA